MLRVSIISNGPMGAARRERGCQLSTDQRPRAARWGGATAVLAVVLSVTSIATAAHATASRPAAKIIAVGAENEYTSVITQIGGRYVSATAIESNPNTDPHTFEASPSVAEVISKARLVVQNGLGYDDYMQKIENGSPNKSRKVIVVQSLLGLPNSTPNPHLWYNPTTMPKVANAIASDLASIDPPHASYYRANLVAFDNSLKPWLRAIANLKAKFPNSPVATTEPVADYMIQAAGLVNKTPFTFQADVMNGVDPSPQGISLEESLLSKRQVRVFVYNQQVTDSLTATFLGIAKEHHVPVVGVYETMPTPGFTYQSWMVAEVVALYNALKSGKSTVKL